MSRQDDAIWTTLQEAGLLNCNEPMAGEMESPWYVKTLLGFSGWVAAVFLLGFIGFGFEFVFENSTIALGTGTVMVGTSFAVLRLSKNEFAEHLALALSLAGQALIIFAIFDFTDYDESIAWFLVTLLQLLLTFLMPNFVHRVFSSFVAAFTLNMTLAFHGLAFLTGTVIMLFAVICWLNEFRHPPWMRQLQAIGYGLVLALIQQTGTALFGYRILGLKFPENMSGTWIRPWMGEVLIGMVALYLVFCLLRRYGKRVSERTSIMLLLSSLVVCIVSMEVQGITVGMVIILLGFAVGNRVLLGLGIASLLFYISSYYYLQDATLLAKSRTLLIVGLVLLFLRLAIRYLIFIKEAPRHE